MFSTLKQAQNLIGRGQRRRWAMLILLNVGVAGFEMVGAALVYVLIGLVANPQGEISLPLLGNVQDLVPNISHHDLTIIMIVAMGIFFLVRIPVQVGNMYVQRRVAENAGARLSNSLVKGYLRWPYSRHLLRSSAEFIRNGHQAVQSIVMDVFVPVITISAEGIMTLALMIFLLTVSPLATAIAVAVLGGSSAVLLLVLQPRLKRLGRTTHRMQRDTLHWLQQSLMGIRDVKILGRESYFAGQYARSRLRLARSKYLRATISQFAPALIEFSLIAFILVFFTVETVVGTGAQSAVPVLGLFAYVGMRLQPSLQKIVNGLNNIRHSTAPVEDIHSDLRRVQATPPPGEARRLPFSREIRLEEVSYRYEESDYDAVDNVSLVIRRGEQVGICGPTGGGKTTVVDLITGLLTATGGSIYVDETPLLGHERDWQEQVGLVSQTVFLVDDTVGHNIALGVQDEAIDLDALQEAISLAQLDEFVDSLTDGLDTIVGERGVRISGGQRQRIAIARALYRRPEVLIFDEGTSALDNTTEANLMADIDRLRGHHTIILVAHRLTTLRSSDRIVFIDKGRVAGLGTYATLQRDNPRFRAMAEIA